MRKTLLAASVAAAVVVPGLAAAQQAAPQSPHTLTGNAALVSDYRFRGISQTYLGPAFQGGFDYSHSSGIYVGNWNSNVASQVYTIGSGIEMDFYGGWKKSFGDFGVDVGYLYYYYPNAEFNDNVRGAVTTFGAAKFDNQEVYVAGSWKWISLKLNYAISDYFGLNSGMAAGGYFVNKTTGAALDTTPTASRGGSKGTYYADFTVTFPMSDKLSLVGHYGMLNVKNYDTELGYNDYKLGVTYDMAGWLLGASYIGTDANKDWYYTFGSKGNKETGKGALVLSVGKTF